MEGIQVFAAYYLGNVQRGMSSLDLYSRMSSPAILSFKLLRYLFVLVILSWRVQSSYLELIVSIRSFCLCLGLIYFLFGLTSKAPKGGFLEMVSHGGRYTSAESRKSRNQAFLVGTVHKGFMLHDSICSIDGCILESEHPEDFGLILSLCNET